MTRARADTLAWSIDLGNGHFVGRYWGTHVPGVVFSVPRNFSGYRSAVFDTRKIAREALKSVRVHFGFPMARVVRGVVRIARARAERRG